MIMLGGQKANPSQYERTYFLPLEQCQHYQWLV
jgi:hypothetical protein